MEQFLIQLVVLAVVVGIGWALLQWMGINIPPVVVRVATILIVGILLVVLIGFLWPLLTGAGLPSLR